MSRARTTIVAVLLILSVASPAGAAEILVDAPEEVGVGEEVEIYVELVDAESDDLAGIEILVSAKAEIVGQGGSVELGSARTDEDGKAVVTFIETAPSGESQLLDVKAVVAGESIRSAFEIEILTGPQLVDQSAPASLPIFSVWWIVGVLALVWVALIYAVSRLAAIRRVSVSVSGAARWVPSIMVGFVVFTAVGMAVVILNRPESHANLEPTRSFDRAIAAELGQDYEYDGLGLSSFDTLDGRTLYEAANCSGCHGINGVGAVVGSALGADILDDIDAFRGEVRRGPDSMPVYPEDQLSDDQVAAIVGFLRGQTS